MDLLLKLNNCLDLQAPAYANDLILHTPSSVCSRNVNRIQTELQEAELWTLLNDTKYSYQKTELMPFGRSRGRSFTLPITFGGTTIASATKVHYLGVVLNSRLSWTDQIAATATKTSFRLTSMRRICGKYWGITRNVMMRFHIGAVLAVIAYAARFWKTSTPGRQHQIAKVQRRAQLMISGAVFSASFAALNVEKGILPMHLQLIQRGVFDYLRLTSVCGKNLPAT